MTGRAPAGHGDIRIGDVADIAALGVARVGILRDDDHQQIGNVLVVGVRDVAFVAAALHVRRREDIVGLRADVLVPDVITSTLSPHWMSMAICVVRMMSQSQNRIFAISGDAVSAPISSARPQSHQSTMP